MMTNTCWRNKSGRSLNNKWGNSNILAAAGYTGSKGGTKMGCPLGSGFDLAMALFVYDPLYIEFKNGAVLRALTDDSGHQDPSGDGGEEGTIPSPAWTRYESRARDRGAHDAGHVV